MKSKYVKGLFTGSVIGIAAGMLLLPQVSNETRRKIMKKSKDMIQNYTGTVQSDEEE